MFCSKVGIFSTQIMGRCKSEKWQINSKLIWEIDFTETHSALGQSFESLLFSILLLC